MIISDGSISITINTADANGDFDQIKSRKITAGGQLRTRTTGMRYVVSELFKVTGSQLVEIFNLINNNAAEYFYTPTTIPPELSAGDFPMSVSIDYATKTEKIYNGQLEYFITLDIESNEVFYK